jgi:hypothetical protein
MNLNVGTASPRSNSSPKLATPGQLIDVGKYRLHLYVAREASPTIVLDSSLGGVEGYFLIEKLSKLTRVCISDRAGYDWSDHSPYLRTSHQIVKELDILLTKARLVDAVRTILDKINSPH